MEFWFKNKAGENFVLAGDYELVGTSDGETLLLPLQPKSSPDSDSDDWEYIEKPVFQVTMNAIVRRRGGERTCTSCNKLVDRKGKAREYSVKW